MASLEDQRHIIEVINQRKEDIGICNAELAKRIGVGKGRIGYILRNERKIYGTELVALCAYFGIGMSEIMGSKDRMISHAFNGRASGREARR